MTNPEIGGAWMQLRRWLACIACCIALAGCASSGGLVQRPDDETGKWQGRLAVSVTHPEPRGFTASFELQGNAEMGQLTLSTPLGTTLAKLDWTAEAAVLTTSGIPQRFDSLQALALHATGVDIPIAQLFDWFKGRQSSVSGWEADLRGFEAGRIVAKRTGANLQAELRILLDR